MRSFFQKLLLTTLTLTTMLPLAACTRPAEETDTTAAPRETTEEGTPETVTDPETATETAEETVEEDEESVYAPDFRVVAYVCLEANPDNFKLDESHLSTVTDLIFIGGTARFDTEGNVIVEDSAVACMEMTKAAVGDRPIRLHINLSGPSSSASAPTWEEQMDNNAREHRKAFKSRVLEKNIKQCLETYGLDGVFFDWEYPIAADHKKLFGDFLVSLDEALGDDYAIGCAVSDWCADFSKKAIAVIDMVELMSYDLFDPTNGLHATTALAIQHVQRLLDLGYAPSQIDLGIPFYARPTTGDAYWYGYNGFYDKLDEDGVYYEESSGLRHSFNTPAVVNEKTAWCIENGIGGVMVWHYRCDATADSGYSLFEAIGQAKADAGVK